MSGSEKVQRLKKIFIDALDGLDSKMKEQALTHISSSNERGERCSSNERLEFLGDAVISLAVALHLYENSPDTPEGNLYSHEGELGFWIFTGKHRQTG